MVLNRVWWDQEACHFVMPPRVGRSERVLIGSGHRRETMGKGREGKGQGEPREMIDIESLSLCTYRCNTKAWLTKHVSSKRFWKDAWHRSVYPHRLPNLNLDKGQLSPSVGKVRPWPWYPIGISRRWSGRMMAYPVTICGRCRPKGLRSFVEQRCGNTGGYHWAQG